MNVENTLQHFTGSTLVLDRNRAQYYCGGSSPDIVSKAYIIGIY